MSHIYYDTHEEANKDIDAYLDHYADFPQLFHAEAADDGIHTVSVLYNAPWPITNDAT